MRTVGLPISHKENERRRALLPVHIGRIQNKGLIYIEEGYGEVLGFADEDYLKEGNHKHPPDDTPERYLLSQLLLSYMLYP